jgi:hypothetical protein
MNKVKDSVTPSMQRHQALAIIDEQASSARDSSR